MVVRKLDNAGWGFSSNCFVCEPTNERGLKVLFFYDEDAQLVTAELCLDDTLSGTPKYVHGGVTLAVLDEAMAWAGMAMAHVFAVTRSITASFERPVRVDDRYRVEARVSSDGAPAPLEATAVVRDADGRVCVRARAELAVMSSDQAVSAIGPLADAEAAYVWESATGDMSSAAEGPSEPA